MIGGHTDRVAVSLGLHSAQRSGWQYHKVNVVFHTLYEWRVR